MDNSSLRSTYSPIAVWGKAERQASACYRGVRKSHQSPTNGLSKITEILCVLHLYFLAEKARILKRSLAVLNPRLI